MATMKSVSARYPVNAQATQASCRLASNPDPGLGNDFLDGQDLGFAARQRVDAALPAILVVRC